MLYRPYDGYGASETELVQTLHNLALSLNRAKQAGDTAAVNGLYAQFQAVAQEYRATGGTSAAIYALINSVHDAVIGTVREVAATAGSAAAGLLTPLKGILVPVAVGIGLIYLAPLLLRKRRA